MKQASDKLVEDFDTASPHQFVEYYQRESLSEGTRRRFEAIRVNVVELARRFGRRFTNQKVLDIGCGAGTQCILWAKAGHRVTGVDINGSLIELARGRASELGLDIALRIGSATRLPCETASMDVCLMPELLEHVADWQACLSEALRVLRPGGILFLSTTNVLCPVQAEFELPFYSWYPSALKRRFERLAVTTRPELANHARYPAVNWFSFYGLRRILAEQDMKCFDRFDVLDARSRSLPQRVILSVIRHSRVARFMAHVCTPGTSIYAVRASAD